MAKKKKSLRAKAQERCDRSRRKIPHLVFFIGDPPCRACREAVRGGSR